MDGRVVVVILICAPGKAFVCLPILSLLGELLKHVQGKNLNLQKCGHTWIDFIIILELLLQSA